MSIPSRAVSASLLVLLALGACTAKDADKKSDTAAASDAKSGPAAVIVNGSPLSQRALDMLLRQQPPQHDAPAARQKVLDNITMQMIVAQEAQKKGLDKTPDVEDQLAMARTSVLAQAYVKDYFDHQQVSDEQLKQAYEKLKAEATGQQYRARHILVKTEAEAEALIAKLRKDPKAFGELASAQSQDPVSKAKGGDLGWFDTQTMVPEFGAAVAQLKKGEFTQKPVKSQFGYHVIVLDDVRAKVDAIPPLDQIKAQLTDQVRQQDLKKALDDLKAKAKIETPQTAKAP